MCLPIEAREVLLPGDSKECLLPIGLTVLVHTECTDIPGVRIGNTLLNLLHIKELQAPPGEVCH